jgi:hypothetical protein
MAGHRATWVRLREAARERFPDDDLAAEITARMAFDTEETSAYAADLDAQVEAHGVLNTACAATRLRGKLRKELRAEGSGASGNRIKEEYVHLDDDDLAYLELPTIEDATEVAVEQRALMASLETQRRDESARRLMTTERRTAADRLAATHQRACHSAQHRNMAAAREAREAAEWCWRLRRGQLRRLLVVVGSRSRISSGVYSA